MDNTGSGGIGFVGLLTIAFIVLKLAGVITWSWLVVLSPIWITELVTVAAFVLLKMYLVLSSRKKR